MKQKSKRWHLEVPEQLDEKLESYLSNPNSDFKTKSEFIRDAVRKRLLTGEVEKGVCPFDETLVCEHAKACMEEKCSKQNRSE